MVTESTLPQNASSVSSTTTMSLFSSSTLAVPTAITLMPVSKKLVCTNHTLWRAKVLAMLQSAQLDSFLEGTIKLPEKVLKIQKGTTGEVEDVPNPAYLQWQAQEQQVLSYFFTSVSHEVLVQVAALPTAAEVWRHIDSAYASHSRAWVINTRMALATTQNGTSPAAEYVAKIKTLADDMASASKKLDDEELCSYILAALDFEYNSFVSSIAARVELISFSELYSQLLAFECSLVLQGGHHSQSSANAATRSRGGFHCGHSGSGFPGHPTGSSGRGSWLQRLFQQAQEQVSSMSNLWQAESLSFHVL
jgi:hypothetical protein